MGFLMDGKIFPVVNWFKHKIGCSNVPSPCIIPPDPCGDFDCGEYGSCGRNKKCVCMAGWVVIVVMYQR